MWQQSSALGDKTGLGSNLHKVTGGTSTLTPCHGVSESWLQKRETDPFLHSTAAFRACSFWTAPSGTPWQAGQSLQQCWPGTDIQQTAQNPCLNKSQELPGAKIHGKQVSLMTLTSAFDLCRCWQMDGSDNSPAHQISWLDLCRGQCLPHTCLFSQTMLGH